MNEYAKLVLNEPRCHAIEVVELATGKTGVASTYRGKVTVIYGADDGSDDKVVSPEDFSTGFRIVNFLSGRG